MNIKKESPQLCEVLEKNVDCFKEYFKGNNTAIYSISKTKGI
jgi:hypothetical protein